MRNIKVERRDNVRRMKNQKGWRCDSVRELLLALNGVQHGLKDLHADDKFTLAHSTGLDWECLQLRVALVADAARTLEADLRREAECDAKGITRRPPSNQR